MLLALALRGFGGNLLGREGGHFRGGDLAFEFRFFRFAENVLQLLPAYE